MMKKLLSFVLIFVIISSAFVIPAFAEDSYQTISEDLKRIYYNGKTYCYVQDDSAIFYLRYISEYVEDYVLSTRQQNTIQDIYLEKPLENDSYMTLSIYYKNNDNFYGVFIEESCLDLYNSVLQGNGQSTFVEFSYAAYLELDHHSVLTEGPVVTLNDYWEYESFSVYKGDRNRTFAINDGAIYVDTSTMNFYYSESSGFQLYSDSVTAYKIVDESTLSILNNEFETYYFGFRTDETNITDVIFFVILIAFFGFIPLAVLVIGIILLVKSKKPYKPYMITIVALAGVELIAFIFLLIKMLI